MTPIDPTVVIERMARRLRSEGATHPVAGALATAVRGHARMAQADFAAATGVPVEILRSAETGATAFGELPAAIGEQASATGADFLALADLDAAWRADPPAQAAWP
jgi:hypothetical protein